MREEALTRARADPPSCTQDADCVLMSTAIRCGEILNIGDCAGAVHREVQERYAAERVAERVCEAVRGAQLGCAVSPLCTGGASVPVCRAGSCVLAPP